MKTSTYDKVTELITKVKKYNPQADEGLIRRAFEVAYNQHLTQKRKSGEAFIYHPLGVAEILTDYGMDTTTIVAALLHDVVEDTSMSLTDIKKEFGVEVTNLINGVTKLGRIEFSSEAEEQAENLRKMLLAMAKDIRVIIIKLADRLHNMRTLCFLSKKKQEEKAKETLEIYAPLAHRLGINQLKSELEDLAFFTLEPKNYIQVQKMLAQSKEERETLLNQVIVQLKQELKKLGIKGQISGRTKHLYSIYQKMVKRNKQFSEIYDLAAVRVIVSSVRDCYATLGIIHSIWRPMPGRFKDYIAMPKFNMYQALHTTVIGPSGKPFEIQIRTEQMHRTAEYGIAAHWRYKEGLTKEDKLDEGLAWLRQMLEWQTETKDPREFMESLKIDLFEDEVFVFTPKGEVISLRAGSTPLDFAYAIHTEVGHHCVGAKVNNQIVPLGYRLQIGDIVEILTNKSSPGPSKDWLALVKTSRAKSKIRQWFSKESREDNEQQGKVLIQKVLRKQGLSLTPSQYLEPLAKVAKEMNFAKVETLLSAVGAKKVSAQQVVTKLINHLNKQASQESLVTKKTLVVQRPAKQTGVKVKGVDGLLVRLAHCCHPVPPDKIIGFVTRGRGLSVHREDCPNAQNLIANPERLLQVSWDTEQAVVYQVGIQVEALDRTRLLRDISAVLSDAGVNILSATVSTKRGRVAVFRFLFEISNLANLNHILAEIKRVDAVFDVYRV